MFIETRKFPQATAHLHLQVLAGQLPREQFSLHQLSMVGIPLQFPMAWHGPLLTTGALLTWVSGLLISFLVTCLRGGTLGIDWPASKIATSEQLKKFSWLPHPMHPLPSGPKFQLFPWDKEEEKIYMVHPENIKLFWISITICIPWFNLATNQTLSYSACIDRNFLVEINYIAVRGHRVSLYTKTVAFIMAIYLPVLHALEFIIGNHYS